VAQLPFAVSCVKHKEKKNGTEEATEQLERLCFAVCGPADNAERANNDT